MMRLKKNRINSLLCKAARYSALLLLLLISLENGYASLPDTIASIRSSIVAVGTYSRLENRPFHILGTGFAVMNGKYVATNAHVIPSVLNNEKKERIIIYIGKGKNAHVVNAEVVAIDKTYDLALLRIAGEALNPMILSQKSIREGEQIAFTGFPLGTILGLYPVTHHGIISSITPIVIPARSERELTANRLKQLRNPYLVYQLDAVAYPGNSGSPVYNPETGEVIAIINKVLVKATKEAVLTDPSAITYSIPIRYLQQMINDLQQDTKK